MSEIFGLANALAVKDKRIAELEQAIEAALEWWDPLPDGEYRHYPGEEEAREALQRTLLGNGE